MQAQAFEQSGDLATFLVRQEAAQALVLHPAYVRGRWCGTEHRLRSRRS
jgi:hypothetical protein